MDGARLLRRTAVGLLSLVVFAVGLGLLAFHFVQEKVASRMEPPRLTMQPEPAADVTFRTLDGAPQTLAQAKGQVVFLDLWGTWCVQCVAEMPTVERLYEHYKGDPKVRFLIVSRMDSAAAVRAYAHRNKFDLPFYLMKDDDIPPSMHLNQFPSTFLFAKDGSLVAKHIGAADWSDGSAISFIDKLREQ